MILMALAAGVVAAAQVAEPTTVNGQRLGTAQEFTTPGPARVCMNNLMVSAKSGETVTLEYSGIHHGSLRLNRGTSWVDADLGEIFLGPRQIGEVVERRSNSYIADTSDDARLRYGLFGYDDFYNQYRLLVRISGPALEGDQSDRSVLRRIELRTEQSPPCDITYRFGWDVLFGEKPLVERRKQ